MELFNESRGQRLAGSVEMATSLWARLIGLMGRRTLDQGQALILQPGNSIHMFCMRFPIDAIFVDRSWHVLHVANGLRPWRMTRLVLRSKRVIELPAGTCHRTGTAKGDELTLRASDPAEAAG